MRTLLTPNDKIRIYAISVDDREKNSGVLGRIAKDGEGPFPFPILSDPGHKTIDAFGIFDPAYVGQEFEGIPHPSIYILDKKRKVLFARIERDYRKRPTNADLRLEIDKLK